MNDIERAIEFFKGCEHHCDNKVFTDLAIKALEQQLANGWITDRLPPEPCIEDGEPQSYLITLNKYSMIPTQLYYIGNGRWVREHDKPCKMYTNVLAWKQLTLPYKGE